MSLLRRIEIRDPYYVPSLFFAPEALAFPSFVEEHEEICSAFDLFRLEPTPFELFDTVTDLIELERTPALSSYRRIRRRAVAEPYLLSLSDRVSALESKYDRLLSAKRIGDRKYTWTTEIKGKEAERKYKFTAEIGGGKKEEVEEKHHHLHHRHHHHKHGKGGKKSYKWIAEIKDEGAEGPIKRTYTWEAASGGADESSGSEKKDKKEKKKEKNKEKKEKCGTRVVEIEEPSDHGALALRHAFARRAGIRAAKGKKKELSPQDAALMIQLSFKAYLVRRSRVLRALRELAVAKSKLKEIRGLFNNFSYRRKIVRDAEERQRFSERIILLLLTVDAIEGADLMVRASKKSMVDELEAMLDVVDPQPPGKSLSIRRRTFDVPDGVIQKEIAEGVTQIVRMLEQEEEDDTSEA